MRRQGLVPTVAGSVTFMVVAWLLLAGCAAPTQRDSLLATLPATAARMPAPFSSREPAVRLPSPTSTPTRRPTSTQDMLVPTPLVSRAATTARARVATSSAATPVGEPGKTNVVATPLAKPLSSETPGPDRRRVCIGMPAGEMADYDWGDGPPGLYVNWRVVPDPPDTGGIRFGQMVRTPGTTITPTLSLIQTAARRNPGSLWLIGNEPDVVAQDNTTPEQYAMSYGILYRAIKEADPAAQVAIAGVAQPTPLRMAYLDRVLAAYRQQYGTEMPVDIWNVHAYILREERDSWGVGIPPGMEADRGQLYEIEDHADMTIFRQQIADFRRWMAERGQRDKPLIVSEFGILMPEEYGFPPEAVGRFLVDTFDYFLTARDEKTGYPGDDNRLVQNFCWFSAASLDFPTSDLFDPVTRAITPVGKVFRAYVAALK